MKGRGCKNIWLLRTHDQYGTPSQRRIRCCTERSGFMIKDWRCVGFDSPECPNNKKDKPNDQ